ncbi:MAG: hypothetical protein ACRCZZ_04370, partial [Phocaeicola sp.]
DLNKDTVFSEVHKKILCDTLEHNYTLQLARTDSLVNHIRIYFLSSKDSLVGRFPEAKLRNIRLEYSSSEDYAKLHRPLEVLLQSNH